MFIVLEGLDGAGKSSQLDLLSKQMARGGKKVRTLHFPRLDKKPYGDMIASFLRGEYGTLDLVHPRLTALLYALDRKEAAADLRQILAGGEILLVDRYVLSNLAYQGAKIAGAEEKSKLVNWIETLEYVHHGIPRPDLTLFLDAPLSFTLEKVSGARMGADRDYLKGKRDIHEASQALQKLVRQEFLALAKMRPSEIAVVDCSDPEQENGMAAPAMIQSRVTDALRYHALIK